MPVPHRSTEPARPRASDTLVDFHTDNFGVVRLHVTSVNERVGLFLKGRHELLLEVAVELGALAGLRGRLADDRVELRARPRVVRRRRRRRRGRLLVWEDVGSRASRGDASGRLAFVFWLKILCLSSGHYTTHAVNARVNPFLVV